MVKQMSARTFFFQNENSISRGVFFFFGKRGSSHLVRQAQHDTQ